mgnify:CR=1 FL=1
MRTYVVYKNGYNKVKAYEIEMPSVQTTDTVEVYDVRAGHTKTFYREAILEEADSFEEAEKRASELQPEWIGKEVRHGRMSDWERRNVNHWEKPEVTFTGFKSAERAELEALAEEFGMFVRRGIGPSLGALVIGDRAGGSKEYDARELGIPCIKGREAFEKLLHTGEVLG